MKGGPLFGCFESCCCLAATRTSREDLSSRPPLVVWWARKINALFGNFGVALYELDGPS